MRLVPLAFALLSLLPAARAAERVSLTQAMADPDWIGNPVERAWWRWDGKSAYYLQKRDGASIRDTWRVGVDGSAPARLDDAARADLDADGAVIDAPATAAPSSAMATYSCATCAAVRCSS